MLTRVLTHGHIMYISACMCIYIYKYIKRIIYLNDLFMDTHWKPLKTVFSIDWMYMHIFIYQYTIRTYMSNYADGELFKTWENQSWVGIWSCWEWADNSVWSKPLGDAQTLKFLQAEHPHYKSHDTSDLFMLKDTVFHLGGLRHLAHLAQETAFRIWKGSQSGLTLLGVALWTIGYWTLIGDFEYYRGQSWDE